MTTVTFDPIKIGEARRYNITIQSTTLDLTTVTSFVFHIRTAYDADPVIAETVLAAGFTSVAADQIVVPVILNTAETILLSARNYIVGGECRVGVERYPALEGTLVVQNNPVKAT